MTLQAPGTSDPAVAGLHKPSLISETACDTAQWSRLCRAIVSVELCVLFLLAWGLMLMSLGARSRGWWSRA